PDGKLFLAQQGLKSGSITVVNMQSGKSTVILRHSHFPVFGPRFSPDGKWIAFLMLREPSAVDVVVAPFRGEADIPEQEWIAVASAAPGSVNFSEFWSPNGELLYYVRETGGQSYIMAQRLDRGRHPAGTPFRVYQFSGRVRPQAGPGFPDTFTAVPAGIVAAMREFTNNIWMMDLPK
ncbi:MAG: hypothetical protein ABSB86_15800, partial [Bryobacteraceae bacterium]